jgi:excisionase family DNA binding protein
LVFAAKENHMTAAIALSDPLLTVKQLMATLGISRATAYSWLDTGRIESVRSGDRQVRIRKSAVDRFLAELPVRRAAA